MTQFVRQFIQLGTRQKHFQRISTHLGDEFLRVFIGQLLVLARQFVQDVQILVFGQEIKHFQAVLVFYARLDNDVPLIINDLIQFFGGQAQQITDFVGQRTEVPDVCHRHYQFNVPHAFAAHFFLGHLHTATVADDAFVTDALVLAAVAFPIFHGAENPLAEKTAHFGLVSPVVDCFRLCDFAIGTVQDGLWRGQTDCHF